MKIKLSVEERNERRTANPAKSNWLTLRCIKTLFYTESCMFSVQNVDIGNINPRKIVTKHKPIQQETQKSPQPATLLISFWTCLLSIFLFDHDVHSWGTMCHDQYLYYKKKRCTHIHIKYCKVCNLNEKFLTEYTWK